MEGLKRLNRRGLIVSSLLTLSCSTVGIFVAHLKKQNLVSHHPMLCFQSSHPTDGQSECLKDLTHNPRQDKNETI